MGPNAGMDVSSTPVKRSAPSTVASKSLGRNTVSPVGTHEVRGEKVASVLDLLCRGSVMLEIWIVPQCLLRLLSLVHTCYKTVLNFLIFLQYLCITNTP
jgi:hypothetical protein